MGGEERVQVGEMAWMTVPRRTELRRFAAFCGILRRFAAFCGVLRQIAANCIILRVLRCFAAFCGVFAAFSGGVFAAF
jgi:E3 ubiquitin-protein ligase DOA10